MSETNSPDKEGLFEEAAAWFARMRGPDAEASRADFERWLARGALHRAAYNRAAEVFAMGKLLADERDGDVAEAGLPRSGNKPLMAGAIAAGLVLFVSASVLVLHSRTVAPVTSGGSPPSNQTEEVSELTAGSGTQSIRLADNSLVRLETNAALAVQYGPVQRRLALERGNARFYVAHEPRPFIVYAGGGFVVAHGTVFDVGVGLNQRVTVRLIQGVVDVTAPPPVHKQHDPEKSTRLRPGQAISFASIGPSPFASAGAGSTGPNRPPSNAEGAQDYRSVPLSELVRLANDGAARPIRIADEATARLRISGKFRIDDTNVLAERIAALFNLIIDRSNPAEIVLRSK